jgi:hypothetical protein
LLEPERREFDIMAIRFLLVSLVAGLGVEPPNATEVAGWAKSGRDWVVARIDDFKGACLVAESEQADAEFRGVVSTMADGFTADLAAVEVAKPKVQIAFEPISVPEELESGIAFALNREAQGGGQALAITGPPSDLPPLVVEIAGPPSELAPVPALVSQPPIEEPVRANRIASALSLTRQAALAWMTLLHDTDSTMVRH